MSAFLIHQNLAPLAKVAAKKNARYTATAALHLIRTEAGYRVEATDGRRAAVVEGESPAEYRDYPHIPAIDSAPNSATQALIPAAELVRISREVPKRGTPVVKTVAVSLGDTCTTLGATDLDSATIRQPRNVEGKFPDFSQIFTEDAPVASIRVDAALLAELLEVAAVYSLEGSGNSVQLDLFADKHGKTNTRPMRITSANAQQKFTGLLVPLVTKGE